MPVTQMDRKTFLTHLRQSGLIGKQELRAVKHRLPASDRGRVIARALVQWGLLTKFQAELLLAGRTSGFLLGQYRILDQLGQGGMGRVFKAVHQTMNRVVALKILAPHLVKTEKAQVLFQREVRAAARLIHPNIVTAYDANQIGDRHYLVMEYVDGPNLEQLVRQLGPLPIGLACDLMRQTAAGLQYAFEMSMVHRDVKPANILVQSAASDYKNAPCVAKILDFGLARIGDADQETSKDTILTRPNVVMGTPDYLSPEQSKSLHGVDIRSDLYSLGCTFYFLLTGKVPHPGGNTLEKLIRHSTEEPAPVEQLRPEIPPEVVYIVHRLMAKDAAVRFQTPAEVAEILVPFSEPAPLPRPAAPPSASGPAIPNLDSNPPFPGVSSPPPASNPESALVNTMGGGLSPTPLTGSEVPSGRSHRGDGTTRRLWRLGLGIAVVVAAATLGIAGWMLAH